MENNAYSMGSQFTSMSSQKQIEQVELTFEDQVTKR